MYPVYDRYMIDLYILRGMVINSPGISHYLTSGKHTKNYGTSPCLMGKPATNQHFH